MPIDDSHGLPVFTTTGEQGCPGIVHRMYAMIDHQTTEPTIHNDNNIYSNLLRRDIAELDHDIKSHNHIAWNITEKIEQPNHMIDI